jgi:hypothetical protein
MPPASSGIVAITSPEMIVTFEEALAAAATRDQELLPLDDSLQESAHMNPRHALLVESQDWRAARAWPARQVEH